MTTGQVNPISRMDFPKPPIPASGFPDPTLAAKFRERFGEFQPPKPGAQPQNDWNRCSVPLTLSFDVPLNTPPDIGAGPQTGSGAINQPADPIVQQPQNQPPIALSGPLGLGPWPMAQTLSNGLWVLGVLRPWVPYSWAAKVWSVAQETTGIAFTDDPNMLAALQDGKFGTQQTVTSDAYTLRAAKIVFLGASHMARIYEQYPGGPATVELLNTVDFSIGRGKPVEGQAAGPTKHVPGQSRDKAWTSTFGEIIYHTHRGNGEVRKAYLFDHRGEAEQFLNDFMQRASLLTKYLPEFGIQDQFDDAYRAYTLARNGKESGAYGGDYGAAYSPFGAKAYYSTTVAGINDALDTVAPGLSIAIRERITPYTPEWIPAWVPEALFGGIGLYGEAGFEPKVGLKYSFNDPDKKQYLDRTEDLNPSAPSSLFAQARIDYRAFGALSVGTWAPLAKLEEGTFLGGGGAAWDRHGGWFNPVQFVNVFEWNRGHLDPNASQFFRDARLNSFPGTQAPHLNGIQGLYGVFDIDRRLAKFELRYDIAATPVETLLWVYRSEIENAGPHVRFREIGSINPAAPSLFDAKQWEIPARAAYESTVSMRALSDEEWSGVLHDALDWGFFDDTVYSWLFNSAYGEWADTYITQAHIDAYAQWDAIGAQKIKNREDELKRMEPYELYQAYSDAGLRYPGVYIGIHQGDKTETLWGGGFSLKHPAKEEQLAKEEKVDLNNAFGLYQGRYTGQEENSRQVGSLAITHKAWLRTVRILQDPVAGPAFVALFNRYAYPRMDASGKLVDPSPLAVLMYRGTTPTRAIEALQVATGYRRDLSHIPGIYKVSAGDRSFDDIGGRALERFYGAPVSPAEAHAYGERIKDLNFNGVPDPKSEIFENALILLPAPPAKP